MDGTAVDAETNPPLSQYPSGWYLAEFSHPLKPGDITALNLLGQELVLFRANDDSVHLIEPKFPYFGTHFDYGSKLVDNQLRLAFHGWGYDAHIGKCVHIPIGDPIPKQD